MRPHLDYIVQSGGQDIVIDVFKPYNVAGVVGSIFWVVVYALVIHQGFKEKTYGIPQYAVCLNFGWEILGSFVIPNPIRPWLWLEKAWFFLDLVIVWQVLRFGPARETIPEIRRYHTPVILGGIALGCVGQWTFVTTFDDTLAFMVAFLIDFVMSVLFVFLFFERRDPSNVTYAVAWTKMLGNLGVSIQSAFFLRALHPTMKTEIFFDFLFAATFVFDWIYIGLIWNLRRARGSSAATAATAPA